MEMHRDRSPGDGAAAAYAGDEKTRPGWRRAPARALPAAATAASARARGREGVGKAGGADGGGGEAAHALGSAWIR